MFLMTRKTHLTICIFQLFANIWSLCTADTDCPQNKHLYTNCTNPCFAGPNRVFCESDHSATCRPDYCGGCIARFFDDDKKEVHCETEYGFICEMKTHTISCLDQPGKVLDISFANYGRTSATVCMHPFGLDRLHNNTDCGYPRSLDVVRKLCQGTPQCAITVDNDVFGGDPCYGIYKYLEIEYECLHVPPDKLSKATVSSARLAVLVTSLITFNVIV